ALGLLQRLLDVGHGDVEGDVPAVALRALADAAADAHVAVGGLVVLAVDHPVVHRVVAVDLPAEQLAVVLLQLLAVLADDLEVHDCLAHLVLLSLGVTWLDDERAPNSSTRERRKGPPRPLSHVTLARDSDRSALALLGARHVVERALRVADLRRRRVAEAAQAAVDRVRHVLVPVGVGEHVAAQVYGAVHVVADEAHPEPVVAGDAHSAVDLAVLDSGPGDVERAAEWARAALRVDPAVDRHEVDLQVRGARRVHASADGAVVARSLFAPEHEGRTRLDVQA